MTYELAKQLKDAGFPQQGKGEDQWYIGSQRVRDEAGMQADYYYFPTLSELIEACKKQAPVITLVYVEGQDYWKAGRNEGNTQFVYEGKTPFEAVAKLWLELNKDNLNKDE